MPAWYVENGRLTHENLPASVDPMFIEPYPPGLWYVESGALTHSRLPKIIEPDDISFNCEERPNEIRVYDVSEPQDGFDHNGLAILDPSECISIKEFNARWDVTLDHPIDELNKWHWLVGQNVLRIGGQLFRIDEVENCIDAPSAYVHIHAKHISYDLADVWIEYSGIGSYNSLPHTPVTHGTQYMEQLMSDRVPDTDYEGYTFEFYSDITAESGELSGEVRDQSLMAALIGSDDCFANRFKGELYRDNFYLSMNSTMEKSRKQAFIIRYGADMTKIKQKIDYSEWLTWLKGVDNQNNQYAVSFTAGSEWIIHHHKQKRLHFNYSNQVNDPLVRLREDVGSYYGTVNTPKVTYEIEIAMIKNDPLYEDFLQLQEFDVGDTGYIYCDILDIYVEQRIMQIKRNELTGDIISISLGNMKNSLIRPSYMGSTISSGNELNDKQVSSVQLQLDELTFVSVVNTPITDIDGDFLLTKDEEYILYF